MGACGPLIRRPSAVETGVMSWCARSSRPDVYPEHRLSVARILRLPPRSTLYDYSILELGRHARSHPRRAYAQCREAASREASRPPRSSTARASRARKRGPALSSGYDAGKKIKGKKRHILVDTQGLLMHAIVHAANVQDRDGGALLMASFRRLSVPDQALCRRRLPGPEFQSAIKRFGAPHVEIVKRSGQATGFVALPKRWIVERTFAWLGRCRRLAKDWECLNHKALAFLRLASIRLMLRKLCNPA